MSKIDEILEGIAIECWREGSNEAETDELKHWIGEAKQQIIQLVQEIIGEDMKNVPKEYSDENFVVDVVNGRLAKQRAKAKELLGDNI